MQAWESVLMKRKLAQVFSICPGYAPGSFLRALLPPRRSFAVAKTVNKKTSSFLATNVTTAAQREVLSPDTCARTVERSRFLATNVTREKKSHRTHAHAQWHARTTETEYCSYAEGSCECWQKCALVPLNSTGTSDRVWSQASSNSIIKLLILIYP